MVGDVFLLLRVTHWEMHGNAWKWISKSQFDSTGLHHLPSFSSCSIFLVGIQLSFAHFGKQKNKHSALCPLYPQWMRAIKQYILGHALRQGFFSPLPGIFFPHLLCQYWYFSSSFAPSLGWQYVVWIFHTVCFPSRVATRRRSCRDLVRRSCQDSSFGELVPRHCRQFCRRDLAKKSLT